MQTCTGEGGLNVETLGSELAQPLGWASWQLLLRLYVHVVPKILVLRQMSAPSGKTLFNFTQLTIWRQVFTMPIQQSFKLDPVRYISKGTFS